MRGISRVLVPAIVALTLSASWMTPASAGGRALDSYCGESGDFCTYVVQKDGGDILFQIRAFANYFGRSEACVTKDTKVCHGRSPRRSHGLFIWNILWQENYPDEGSGRYAVRWNDENGNKIGHVLHFER